MKRLLELILFLVFWFFVSKGFVGLWPSFFSKWYWVPAAVVFAITVVFVLLNYRTKVSPESKVQDKSPYVFVIIMVIALGTAIFWHFQHASDLKSLPINPNHADMLPLLLEGFSDLDGFQSPYRAHDVGWILHNYFLPTTFLPYYIFYKLGLDIRWLTVFCLDLIYLSMLMFIRFDRKGTQQVKMFILWFVVINLIGSHVHILRLVRITQLGPFWLYTCLAFLFLAHKRLGVSTIFFAMALCSRETSLSYAVVPALGLLRFERQKAKRLLLASLAGIVLIFLPFFVSNPYFFTGNIKQYSSLQTGIKNIAGHPVVGFSGLLNSWGALGYHWWLLISCCLGIVGLYLFRSKDFDVYEIIKHSFGMGVMFALFSIVTYDYAFVFALIILSIYILAVNERFSFWEG